MTDTISLTYDALIYMTDRAALFDFDGDQQWIPLSLIDSDSLADLDPEGSDTPGEVMVATWFAKQEGLEPYES